MADQYEVPHDIPVCELEAKAAFEGLKKQEKQYAHHIARASWEASRIVLLTTSHESAPVFAVLLRTFGAYPTAEGIERDYAAAAKAAGVSDAHWNGYLAWCAAFFANTGNYRSFGDTKLIPAVPAHAFEACVRASAAFSKADATLDRLLPIVLPMLYDRSPHRLQLNLSEKTPGKSCSSYYSTNCTQEDAARVQKFLQQQGIEAWNQRLWKHPDGSYEVRVASADAQRQAEYPFDGTTVRITHGDFAPLMQAACKNLDLAIGVAANDTQRAMLRDYIQSFTSGSVEAHKNGSRHWVRDLGPAVESYIGFIEAYRDPFGTRGEWEGFVAVVNRKTSETFAKLVNTAEKLLPSLPWPTEFEKDKFQRPDFTALEVVAFAGSGVPAGINIPNYDSVRGATDGGFKNVSLSNVLAAAYSAGKGERISFIRDIDQDAMRELMRESFEVQVGLHELLGHGSGKLFHRKADGAIDFPDDLKDPLSGKSVSSMPVYGPGETYESKFTDISSSYEEARAECVGVYLCCLPEVLAIFGLTDTAAAERVMYINWLSMARAGLMSLLFYSPEKQLWGQAHMRARFGILQAMLAAGKDFVKIVKTKTDGKDDLEVHMDAGKIRSVGQPAIGEYLRKLQVFKSTGNADAGRKLYEEMTMPSMSFLEYRDVVVARRKPRKLLVQPNTRLDSKTGDVSLLTYPPSHAGILASVVDRYSGNWDSELLQLWESERPFTGYEPAPLA